MPDHRAFILRIGEPGSGLRLAVKDVIQVRGVPRTCGSRAVADNAQPAPKDASCLTGARDAGVSIVGLTNLDELACGISGINSWFGTPVNPVDPSLIPGGSSSGSAVAVGNGAADIAYGTDTTGSIRNPAACCGVVGLKTTHGRIAFDGIWPAAPSMDVVGPLGRTISAVVLGMQLLEPGFAVSPVTDLRIARFRIDSHPAIEEAIDSALARAELRPVDITLRRWDEVSTATTTLASAEYWQTQRRVFETRAELLGDEVREDLVSCSRISCLEAQNAKAVRNSWRLEIKALFSNFDVIAMPTLTSFPPKLDAPRELAGIRAVRPWSLAGVPALSLPVPTSTSLPASLQLVATWGREELLLAVGDRIESAIA